MNTKQKIQKIINSLTRLDEKRRRIAQDLALKLGRPPTFIEVTEELRKIQGDKRLFLPSNIISNLLVDAFLLTERKNLSLAEEKIEKAAQVFLLSIEKKAIPFSKIPLIGRLFAPILQVHLKKKIFPKRIEKIIVSCFSLQNLKNKNDLNQRVNLLKELLKK